MSPAALGTPESAITGTSEAKRCKVFEDPATQSANAGSSLPAHVDVPQGVDLSETPKSDAHPVADRQDAPKSADLSDGHGSIAKQLGFPSGCIDSVGLEWPTLAFDGPDNEDCAPAEVPATISADSADGAPADGALAAVEASK